MSKILGHKLSKSIVRNCTAEKLVQDVYDHFISCGTNVAMLKSQGKLVDLLEDVCSIVELSVPKNSKIDKKLTVMSILLKLYPEFTESERLANSRDIEYYVKHSLKAVGRARRLARWVKSLVCSLNGSQRQSA